MQISRLVVSGLSGGAGKSMVSLGLARALTRLGLRVKAYKKGPDYIDAAWLALACRSSQSNLDPFFLAAPALRSLFLRGAAGHELALVEGNRGLFDGLDLSGSCSTAELARVLRAPVLLVLDCTKMTRTAAALVKGCLAFEEGLSLGGVILNRIGNARHRSLVRRAVEELAGVPVLGMLPRREKPFITEGRTGLVNPEEEPLADAGLEELADFVAAHTDIEAIRRLAASAPALAGADLADLREDAPRACAATPCRARVGYVRDAAFCLYYQENLDALRACGAELVRLSVLPVLDGEDAAWDGLDGVYIGGGQPERYAKALSANRFCREKLADLSRRGVPVYAEGAGAVYLAEELLVDGVAHPMAGVFPCRMELCARPQGLGYVEAEVLEESPFHPAGACFRAHEFHFFRCLESGARILRLRKGRGMRPLPESGGFDGLRARNSAAFFSQVFAPALPHWAEQFVALCERVRDGL